MRQTSIFLYTISVFFILTSCNTNKQKPWPKEVEVKKDGIYNCYYYQETHTPYGDGGYSGYFKVKIIDSMIVQSTLDYGIDLPEYFEERVFEDENTYSTFVIVKFVKAIPKSDTLPFPKKAAN